MNVMRFNGSVDMPGLVAGTSEVPQPKPGEVLIKVHASGVTPTELVWYPTTHRLDGTARNGAVPGHEFSGVIEQLGEGVDGFVTGQAVYGMNDWFGEGATAEYCVAKVGDIALKPAGLSHAEAATVPIGALTAWQGLFDRAALKAGERVLIHGGAGAVGLYAIQLAKRAGAVVLTTASRKHEDFLKELGADVVIDYREERFEDKVGSADVVFDGVGGETLKRSWGVLRNEGRLVTIAADSEGTADEKAKKAFFIVEANGKQLAEIAEMLEKGELRTVLDGAVPLADAESAYLGKAKREHGRGKVVVSIIE